MTTEEGEALAAAPGTVVGRSRGPHDLVALGGSGVALPDEQAAIVAAPPSPTLVVAGAGSGKTETLALRFLYLLDHARGLFGRDLAPDEILCLTFTRKAAGEIAERVATRVDHAFGPDADRPMPAVSTYNAYAFGLVAEHGLRVGVDPDSVILTNASLWQLAAGTAQAWEGDLAFDGNLSAAAAAIPALASALADHGTTIDQFVGLLGRIVAKVESLPLGPRQRSEAKRDDLAAPFRSRAALAGLVDSFAAAKRAGSFLDFSDQIAAASRLATVPAVQALERARYRAVLLDEFQDTSPGQLDLFSTLFGRDHPVMAVGDPHQAIYGFRGASEAALDRFVERFAVADSAVLTLSVSWRNSSAVLSAANASTASLRATASRPVPTLRSRTEATGVEEVARVLPAVALHTFSDATAEADGLVRLLLERTAALEAGRPDGVPVEAAVLCRVRRLFPAIVSALKGAGVDFQVVGLGGLMDTPVIVDVLALLQVAHDPSRGDSLMRLLTSERLALGIRDLAALGEWAEELAGAREAREVEASIGDALDDLPPAGWVSPRGRALGASARLRLVDLAEAVAAIRRHGYLSVPDLIAFAARTWNLDIESRVAARSAGLAGGDEHLFALVEAARAFSAGVDRATLGAFLAWLEAAYDREDGLEVPVERPRKGAIQVQTIHAAKGMEWDIVAIPGLVDGTFPKVDVSVGPDGPRYRDGGWLTGAGVLPWPLRRDRDRLPTWDWESPTDLKEFETSRERFRDAAGVHAVEEERRLFYVALTRARTDVILTAAPIPDGPRPRPLSTFVRGLLADGVVDDGGLHEAPVAPEGGGRVGWPAAPSRTQLDRRQLATEVVEAISVGAPASVGGLPHGAEIAALLKDARAEAAEPPAPRTHLSSTDLVGLARDPERFALDRRRPIPTEPGAAALRGAGFHSWVERYFRSPSLVDPDEWWEGDDGDDRGAGDADSDVESWKSWFLASEWAHRTPEAVEAYVEIPLAGRVLRCRIDAVFPPGRGLDKVTVVDWKTGRPPSEPTDRAAREVQLAAYRLAWAAWTGVEVESVDAAFIYVSTGETVRPARLIGRDELVALVVQA